MDGLEWKTLLKWMIWKYIPLFSETFRLCQEVCTEYLVHSVALNLPKDVGPLRSPNLTIAVLVVF